MKHRFNYEWNLKDTKFTKDKGSVFSCFSGGGGSSFGYKLAGFDVIGCNESDWMYVEHLAYVHYDLAQKFFAEKWMNIGHSVIVVIIFEIVVITFVIQGKKTYSKLFTWCIWILSMIYYDANILIQNEEWVKLTSATVYSTIFTVSIYMFSEMLAEWYQEENWKELFKNKIKALDAEVIKSKTMISAYEKDTKKLENLISENRSLTNQLLMLKKIESKRQEALKCPHCRNFIAESEAQLRSHKGHCPDNPKNKN